MRLATRSVGQRRKPITVHLLNWDLRQSGNTSSPTQAAQNKTAVAMATAEEISDESKSEHDEPEFYEAEEENPWPYLKAMFDFVGVKKDNAEPEKKKYIFKCCVEGEKLFNKM